MNLTTSSLSTGEYIIKMDIKGKRYGTLVIAATNITKHIAENIHRTIMMQANTYGDKAAIEMYDHYRDHLKQTNHKGF